MSKVWRIVLIIALALIVLGVVLLGVGLLTGASLDRMVELVFGGWEMLNMMLDVIKQELLAVF